MLSNQNSELEKSLEFDRSSGSGEDEYQHTSILDQLAVEGKLDSEHLSQVSYDASVAVYQTPPFVSQPHLQHHRIPLQYSSISLSGATIPDVHYSESAVFPTPSPQALSPNDPTELWRTEHYNSTNLSDALGQLAIDETGLAPYIYEQKKTLAETPAFEEFEDYKHTISLTPPGPDLAVRIPPELMPSEEQAIQFFDIFFTDIHPYIPVINKSYFYQQWRTKRVSISPLILEGIFSCAGRMSNDPSQGTKWLYIAGKHEDCFNDVPRLSTIQAMLLILKARESAPKRGYYYRSWMTIVKLVTMAKDLGLHEHYALHQAGKMCGSTTHECVAKTQVWRALFILELMIGGPQGRYDMNVDVETVDCEASDPVQGLDDGESLIYRNFALFAKIIMRIRRMGAVSLESRKRGLKDFAIDPEFVKIDAYLDAWQDELPADMRVTYPAGGSTPWIPSHYAGNLHAYFNLAIIMLRRPQLALSASYGVDGEWKQQMSAAYTAAKRMCRLQEAILEQYGLMGHLCMLRDRELNSDAQDYFTRHMRILERCASQWPMPDMRAQIDALREAFSADTSKPFTLRSSFPHPSLGLHIPNANHAQFQLQVPRTPQENISHPTFSTHPPSPPTSASDIDPKGDSPAVPQSVMLAAGHQQPLVGTVLPLLDAYMWNPSRIFDQWNTAFGQPPPPITQSSGPQMLRYPFTHDVPHHSTGAQEADHPSVTLPCAPAQGPSFVTPTMWQDSVAAVYGESLKRPRDYGH
ncbi:hypothetical protein FGG08_001642 [Glutinoglossum americanum]|uniref:Xylanolytic transcriptional activator regulatory domain-containing protein n=1 Tax=Glutinoglossum americanum TaxID=1670608 RepID=A0A9P8IEH9_9PEZI|nr:hypothetical protein FGG08_001642 [Glutinoglossum americanum]